MAASNFVESRVHASRTALITGGGGDLAGALRDELEARGHIVHAPNRQSLDVTSTGDIETFFKSIERIDLLVHNAGLCKDTSMAKMQETDFAEVLNVCLTGAFRVSRAALKLMSKQRHGHIVMIGSFSALRGPAGQANYAAAKAGLIGLTQSLALEYGSRNIRVNCVLPGFLETKMTAALTQEMREKFRQAHALGRFNTTLEVARFIAFLDQQMPNTSGQVFNLDSRVHRWT